MVKDSRSDPRYLISSIHHRSDLRKKMAEKAHNSAPSYSPGQTAKPRPFPVPDGLPKTQEEIDEDEEALMPESPYTRLLRRMGRYPDWYTPRPDHETDWITPWTSLDFQMYNLKLCLLAPSMEAWIAVACLVGLCWVGKWNYVMVCVSCGVEFFSLDSDTSFLPFSYIC